MVQTSSTFKMQVEICLYEEKELKDTMGMQDGKLEENLKGTLTCFCGFWGVFLVVFFMSPAHAPE